MQRHSGGEETIFATSTGTPPAALAIIRISGTNAHQAGRILAERLPPIRRAAVRTLRDPGDGGVLDQALVLAFEAPRSSTGEDVVELHCHGGRAVIASIERALGDIPGLRHAQPGEFTRRALRNGVLDLLAAEGLADLLRAETETQRRVALQMTDGSLRARCDRWMEMLTIIAAQIEAQIDFAEESDVVRDDELQTVHRLAGNLVSELAEVLSVPSVDRLMDGFRVVLAGPPNSGKSTLLNALVGHEAAIVSPISGTTRDRIEVPVVRDGIAYLLIDTAGLRNTDDPIEKIGVTYARRAMDMADLILWLGDDRPPVPASWVHARADLPGRETCPPECVVSVAARYNTGIAEIWEFIANEVEVLVPTERQVVTNARQRAFLSQTVDHLRAALSIYDAVIRAEEIRMARERLGRITGVSDMDTMLDTLFSSFCIGK